MVDVRDITTVFQGGVRLAVKAKPGSSRSRAPKIVELEDSKHALEIAVSAVPEDGKANKAIIKTISEGLGIRKSDIEIKIGAGGRLKIIELSGSPDEICGKISAWLEN
ncbi:MAG: DUF167 domain-containing protein [Alphaproteobacteria bacterium]|nr:DUF167 domain-containing protein [Alphaproteobacteria bacterium]